MLSQNEPGFSPVFALIYRAAPPHLLGPPSDYAIRTRHIRSSKVRSALFFARLKLRRKNPSGNGVSYRQRHRWIRPSRRQPKLVP
jgi:hypothetical protein